MVDSLNTVADALGTMAADRFYKAGVTQGEAFLKGVMEAIAVAEAKLKNPNLKLTDIKGIGASFSSSVAGLTPSSVSAPALSSEERAGIAASRGNAIYNISVNGGLATSAEIGRLVIDNIKAANRAYGPAAIEVL